MHKRIFIFLNLLLIFNLALAEPTQKIPELPNFSSLAEKVTPAVVNVSVTKVIKSPAQGDMRRGPFNDPFFDEFLDHPIILQTVNERFRQEALVLLFLKMVIF